MPKKKKFIIPELEILSYAAEGKCIGRYQDKIVFVEGVVPGDVAEVFVHKNKKDWAEAKCNKIVKPSSQRQIPFCSHFEDCGGCKWQMLPYPQQLMYKDQQVRDQLQRIGKVQVQEYLPIVGAESNRLYRNKLEFTFSTKRYLNRRDLESGLSFDQPVLGFHAPRLFDKVIDIETCHLQPEPSNAIKNFVRSYALQNHLSFYDIREHQGLLRNLMIRVATTGQVLVNLVFGENQPEQIFPLLDTLFDQGQISSLHYTINTKLNDSLYDQNIIHYRGSQVIEEKLEDFVFDISPKSFFQTNTRQAENLYRVARNMANLKPSDTLYDLYCGTGSIGIFMSKHCGRIIGVETIEDAVKDARINAEKNHVKDALFFAGDVIKVCDDHFFTKHGRPDVIVIDPPRAGCHDDLLNKLLHIRARTIVYVSCNPATQARDLQRLSEAYHCTQSQAVDMFPHTHHVENVVKLELK
jgi:23S rRNA (uracil1939-C5)-methyltransferase